MSKWKSKFSSMINSLKKGRSKSDDSELEDEIEETKSNNTKRKKKSSKSHADAQDFVENMEWEDGESAEVHGPPPVAIQDEDATSPSLSASHLDDSEHSDEENYEGDFEEEYDGEYEDEDTQSFSTLTVNQIKQSQIESGETTPDLPPMEEDNTPTYEYEEEEENDFDLTNPAIREYTPKKTLRSKLKNDTKKLASSNKSSKAMVDKLKSINLDEFFEAFYAPQNRRKIHFTFLFLLFTGVSIKSAQIISTLLTPLPSTAKRVAPPPAGLNEADRLKNALAQLESNDLFRAPRKGKEPVISKPKVKEEAICLDAKKRSSLSIKLLSTVVLQDEVKSLASVQQRKDAEYLRKGDSIPGVLEVGRIAEEKIFFKNLKTRECEYIENAPKGPKRSSSKIALVREPKKAKKIIQDTKKNGISNVGNQFKIKKEVRARMLENISEVLTQARAVQIKNPDGSLAFRMQEVVPGSIYSQLNIENGDVVTGINGEKIKNVSELMQLFGRIDKIDHFELNVKKQGIEQSLQYDFE